MNRPKNAPESSDAVLPPEDPLDPVCGGWLPPGAALDADPDALGSMARRVRALLVDLRREAATAPGGLDESGLRGLATLAALADAVRSPDADPAALFGQLNTRDLSEPVEALVDAETRDLARQCLGVCETVSGAVRRAQSMRKMLRERADAERKRRSAEQRAALPETTVPGLPGIDGPYRVPSGWRVADDGLYRLSRMTDEGTDWDRIAPAPVYVIGSSEDLTTGERLVDLFWHDPTHDKSVRRPVDRGEIATSAGLLGLASYGAPVNCENVRQVAAFLTYLEAANAAVLPTRTVVQSMGWVPSSLDTNDRTFLLGRSPIGSIDVTCRPLSGSEQHLDGWTCGGSYDAWEAAARPVVEGYPVPAVMYLAALASPLLALLGRPSFIVDLACETGHGKTTALRLAASVWGNPSESRGVVHSWDGTEDALQKLAGFTGNLPLCLDDTKLAGGSRARDVGQILYRLASGQGRMKGQPRALARVERWSFVCLSTGEAPVVEVSQAAGTRARVLSVTRLPFGEQCAEGRRVTTATDEAARLHFGHAGRRFVEHLATADLDALRTRLAESRAWFSERFDPGTATRLADHGAVLLLAGDLAHDLGLPVPDFDAVADVLADSIRDGAAAADRPRAALVDLLSWVESNPARVLDRDHAKEPPVSGWIATRRADDLAVVKDQAERFLDSRGYDVPGCVRAWAGQRRWLSTPRGRGHTKPVRFGVGGSPSGGSRPRCYVVPWDVVRDLRGDDEGEA